MLFLIAHLLEFARCISEKETVPSPLLSNLRPWAAQLNSWTPTSRARNFHHVRNHLRMKIVYPQLRGGRILIGTDLSGVDPYKIFCQRDCARLVLINHLEHSVVTTSQWLRRRWFLQSRLLSNDGLRVMATCTPLLATSSMLGTCKFLRTALTFAAETVTTSASAARCCTRTVNAVPALWGRPSYPSL